MRITEVTSGSAAEKRGLKSGDIIVRANGMPVASDSEIASLLRDRLVGAATRLVVRHGADGRQHEIVVPSTPQPMLRIDAGMHNAPIRRIALDRNGQWLVTASEDKTAKVWDLATGRFVRSLRSPVGEGSEGRLAALAMSPDATMIAVAGSTGMWGKTASIYVFEPSSGRMTRELGGLPGVIEALARSPDGQYLVASFAGQGGIRAALCRGQPAGDPQLD